MAMFEPKLVKRVNPRLVIITALLLIIGLLALYSASRNVVADSFYYTKRQLVWIAVGLTGAILAFRYDYRKLRAYTNQMYILAIISLLLVFIMGHKAGGSQSWLGFGSVQFQPTEFAKIAIILMLADKLAAKKSLLLVLALTAVPFVLIVMQPDFGSALVFIAIIAGMLFMAGVPGKLLAQMAAALGMAVPLVYRFILKPYQRMRLVVFLNPWADRLGAGYNVIQSAIAVGSGRFFGQGFLQGTQAQLNFLPAHHTDFIFSVFAEEQGFLGAVFLLYLFYLLLSDTLAHMVQSYDRYGMLLVTGLTCMWTFHIIENLGMALGVMPVTGIPLPFISYGGSAMVVNLTAVGLVANVEARRYIY